MSAAAARLYDALQAFESRRRKHGAYPVHKKLALERIGVEDIYDWIIERVGLPAGGSILDAGCGVGFGTIRLAQRCDCRLTGISLSENELAAARKTAAALGLSARVCFERASFDALPADRYDLIVAVESLKHSTDLGSSLAALLRSLRRGGTIVVVEDLYTGRPENPVARRVVRDWGLERLYRQEDYTDVLGAGRCCVIDLSAAVERSARARILAKLVSLRVLQEFVGGETAIALRAFRGGLYLERLYADRELDYKAIVFEREAASRP